MHTATIPGPAVQKCQNQNKSRKSYDIAAIYIAPIISNRAQLFAIAAPNAPTSRQQQITSIYCLAHTHNNTNGETN